MTGVTTVTVRPEDGAGRLDRWFRRHYPGLSHGRLEKLLRTGQVRIDGKRARAGDTFIGVLSAGLDQGLALEPALRRASAAAGLACLAAGAQTAMPNRTAIEAALGRLS